MLIGFKERGREGGKEEEGVGGTEREKEKEEREKHQLVASLKCPIQGSKPQPFGTQYASTN